jgi:hypothetical protein
MFEKIKNFFFKPKEQHKITITINGESFTTEDKEEIAEALKHVSESLKSESQKNLLVD